MLRCVRQGNLALIQAVLLNLKLIKTMLFPAHFILDQLNFMMEYRLINKSDNPGDVVPNQHIHSTS